LLLRTNCPKTGGMTDLTSFRSIIELWGPSRLELASEFDGVSATQVSKWFQRDSIPAEYWSSLLDTSRARDNGVTADLLTRLAARETLEVRA
jgi:hypothetical protein